MTNTVPAVSYRAPAAPSSAFAVESHMDAIAHAMGMDALELRMKNAVEKGDVRPDGEVLPRSGFKETLERMAEYLKQKGKPQGGGWALMEDYVVASGVVLNATLQDCRMPTAADLPFKEVLLVEVSSETGPYGMRPVGEPPLIPCLAVFLTPFTVRLESGLKHYPGGNAMNSILGIVVLP